MSKIRILHLTDIDYNNIADFIQFNINKYIDKDLLVMYMSPYTKQKIREYIGKRLPENYRMNTLFGVNILTEPMRNDEIHIVEYNHKFIFDDDRYIKNDIISVKAYCNSLYGDLVTSHLRENPTLPDKYIVNKDVAILFYGNNKTIVRRSKGDKVDPVKAYLWAYFLHNTDMSRTKANKYLQKVWKTAIEEIHKK